MSPVRELVGILIGLSFCSTGVRAQDRTTEAGEASIKDPSMECKPYDYPPVTAMLSSFPTIWESATILPNDTAAQAKWNSILPSIPTDVQVKDGTLSGNFSNVTYGSDDKDCWWTSTTCTTPKHPGLPNDTISVPEPNTLGYGFDDGPNCSHNAFYDFLAQQNQRATMYFIGSNVMNWPLETQRASTDGHEICCHTWSHQYMTAFSSQDAFAELYYSLQAIKLVTGRTPTCWRPPFGDVDDRIRAIAKGLGLRTIVWSYDTNDWQEGTGNVTAADIDANYQSIITKAQSGAFNTEGTIILTHELNNFTMSEAIKFYPLLKAAFKNLVPVGVGLNITQPYVETNFTQPTFAQYVSGIVAANGTSNTSTSSSSISSSGSGISAGSQSQTTSNPSSNLNAARHLNVLQDGNIIALMVLILGGAAVLI